MEWAATHISSPLGRLLVVLEGEVVVGLDFADGAERLARLLANQHSPQGWTEVPAAPHVQRALDAYFEGDLIALDPLPVRLGGTEFQRRVWHALREIPAGSVTSYGALARQIGASNASRAVGLANGSNPVALLLPCHRVIGANGTLTGYAGGLARKEWLLRHEGALLL